MYCIAAIRLRESCMVNVCPVFVVDMADKYVSGHIVQLSRRCGVLS